MEVRTPGKARAGTESLDDVDVRGVTASIGEMDVEEPATGRYISDADNEHRAMVALLGAGVASRLFPGLDPMGRLVQINGLPFAVVGVAKPIGTVLGQSQDNFAYIPIQTFLKIFGGNRSLSINVQAAATGRMAQTQDEARMLMRARRHLHPTEDDSFGIHDASSLLDLWHQLTGAIAASMVGVVSVFLVIGGVVIMNVMLASVTERTREIGIRKSLGARRRDILLQFLIEAITLSSLGGILGIITGLGTAKIISLVKHWPTFVSPTSIVVAFLFSAAVGIFFGFYPARKAANLDPIDALRYE